MPKKKTTRLTKKEGLEKFKEFYLSAEAECDPLEELRWWPDMVIGFFLGLGFTAKQATALEERASNLTDKWSCNT